MTPICLDAEFVEGDELIELSIYSLDSAEIYHSLYRPSKYTTWDSSIHHITPPMVADAPSFAQEKEAVQRVLDQASHLIGFALENDVAHLRHQGINIPDTKPIVELRNWYWINHGLKNGLDLTQNVSLASVTETLGISFGDLPMHSASGDTLATLSAFKKLYGRFVDEHSLSPDHFGAVVEEFDKVYDREKEIYDRARAHGFVCLLRGKRPGVYTFRFRRTPPPKSLGAEHFIEVEDRQKAELDLRAMFAGRLIAGTSAYRLGPSHIKSFLAYSNSFSTRGETVMARKLNNLASLFNNKSHR